jgi:hypothetical protein
LKRYSSKLSKMIKQFKIGRKTKIFVIFSCFQVHLRFFFEHLKSHKKGGGENFKN